MAPIPAARSWTARAIYMAVPGGRPQRRRHGVGVVALRRRLDFPGAAQLYQQENIPGVVGRLAIGSDGSLYGCTMSEGLYGEGNVFKLTPSNGGWNYTSLHDFEGYGEGAFPERGPTVDSNNNLFGTTYYGGPVSAGVIWEITP